MARLAEQNRNARDFVEGLQKRIYTLTYSSLAGGEKEPREIAGCKIIRRLGTGGSAAVFLAEDKSGKKYALKVLRGFLSDSLSIQRFKSENHILAFLSHPNIARLTEAGMTENGEPYVMMEYVDGTPIDVWCDRNRLSVHQRIRLFQNVCKAVHYAHQNLVVHRDIKPEHVLITKSGEVKLIDFGIAKLLEPIAEIGEFTTRTGMRVMTPEYASPEQVRGEPVSTASDIYSLGVLLYLLATGRRPYEFKTTSMLEIERVVCERDPVKPSDAVKALDTGQGSKGTGYDPKEAARLRGMVHSRLRKLLSGDLDRIVMKAMRKSPSQRYASALTLAGDLDHFIKGEPVIARPPTITYRARKFINRHKLPLAAAAIAVIALFGGLIGTLWQANQAKINAERAEIQAQLAGQAMDFLIDLFESADPAVAQGEEITVKELLQRGTEQALEPNQEPALQLNLLSVLGRVYSGMGQHDKSAGLFEAALVKAEQQDPADPLLIAELQSRLGLDFRVMGNLAAADSLYRLALENRRKELGENHHLTIRSLDDWAGIHAYLNRDADLADSLFQVVVDRRRSALDPYDQDLAESLNNLAYIKMAKREYHLAVEYYEESAEIYRRAVGENHPDRLRAMSGTAVAYHRLGNFGRSEQMHKSLIGERAKVLGENHPQVAVSYFHYAELLKDTGRIEHALEENKKAAAIMEALSAPHQFYPDILFSIAWLYEHSGNLKSAKEGYLHAAEKCGEIRGMNSSGCTRLYRAAGEFFLGQRENPLALIYLQRAYDSLQSRVDPENEELAKLSSLIKSVQ